jgi:hypothetical protein
MGDRRADTPAEARDRRIVAVVSICVALPAAIAAVRAIRWGWVPVSDQATISTRAAEVLTARTPRLGQLSGASAEVGLITRSPGPMGYWPFAVTSRWGPLWGSAVVAAVVSGAAMVGSVRLAARRGGPALALAVAVGLVLTARAINPANLVSTWNPAIGVMPLVLLIFLSWSIGVGELRLLPVAVLVASLCAQAHTVLAVAALPVLAIGVATGLAPGARRAITALYSRERWRPGRAVRPVLAGVVVGAGCWALPLLDQVTGDPGNLTRLSRASPGDPTPWAIVGRVVADVIGLTPAFVEGDDLPDEHVFTVLFRPAAAVAVVASVLVVAGLLVMTGRAVLRRDRERALPGLLVLTALLAGAVSARSTPEAQVLVLSYTTWWLVPIGMLAWVVLGWQVGQASELGPRLARALTTRGAVVGAVAVCAVTAAVAFWSPMQPEPEEPIHEAAGAVGDVVADRVEHDGRYLVVGQGAFAERLVASTAYRIRRADGRPVVPGNDGVGAGPRYAPKGTRCRAIVTIAEAPVPPPDGATVLEEVEVPSRHGTVASVFVAIGPDDGPPSC